MHILGYFNEVGLLREEFSSPALVRSVAFSVSPRRIVEEELIFVIFGSIF